MPASDLGRDGTIGGEERVTVSTVPAHHRIWGGLLCLMLLAALAPAGGRASAAMPGSDGLVVLPVSVPDSNVVDIYTLDPGTGARDRLIANGAANRHPSWSPTGDRLAFASNLVDIQEGHSRSGVYDLFVADADGSDVRMLVEHLRFGPDPATAGVRCIDWSPDGSQLAFVGATRGRTNLYTVRDDGTSLGFRRANFSCPIAWSPDGDAILGYDTSDLPGADFASYDLVSRETTILEPGEHPQWTPDGEQILYHDYAYVPDGRILEIFVMNPDGTGRRRLTFTDTDPRRLGGSAQPLVSPTGNTVLFSRATEDITASIWALDLDGAGDHRVMERFGQWNEADWQPVPAKLTIDLRDGAPSDGHAFPLVGAKVELFEDGEPLGIEPRASFGAYAFPDVPSGEYTARITLEDAQGVFDLRYSGDVEGAAHDPAWIETPVTVPPDDDVTVRVSFSGAEELLSTNVPAPSHLDDIANIFRNVQRFVSWSRRAFGPVLTNLPVQIYAFADTDPIDGTLFEPDGARYYGVVGVIVIGDDMSVYSERDGIGSDEAPENVEWHEFAHHLFGTNVHDGGAPCDPNYTNHGGYANPDTCDSMDEGFATFAAAAASQGIDGATDDQYADLGFGLESHWKAWDRSGGQEREDIAVAALLWDLYDASVDGERTAYRRNGEEATPAGALYTDQITSGIEGVWAWLAGHGPATVADLHALMGTASPIRDVDGDGTFDILPVDEVFLMHGFFPLLDDQAIDGFHRTHHYDLDSALKLGLSGYRNAAVGRTDHADDGQGGLVPRSKTPKAPGSNLLVRVRDAEGRPVTGAEVRVEVDGVSPIERTLAEADALVHLMPPPNGARRTDGPACDPDTQITVSVDRAPEAHTFDGCTWAEAVAATTDDHAMTVDFTFPADGVAPVTEAAVYPEGRWSGRAVSVQLSCTDGPDDGSASGCLRTSYRIDDGPATDYLGEFRIADEGDHTITLSSVDRTGNAEAVQTVSVGIDREAPVAATLNPDGSSYPSALPVPVLGTTSDALSGVTAVCVEAIPVDGGAASGCVEATTLAGLWIATPTLPPGTYDLVVHATDVAGNTGLAEAVRIAVL